MGIENTDPIANQPLINMSPASKMPVIAGSGLPLFKILNDRVVLKLLKTKPFDSEAIVLYYKPITGYRKMTTRAFTPFPVLKTERLTLRQLSLGDAQQIFALRSDDTINKYLGRQPSKTVEDAKNFINNITENINKNESIYWVITLTESKTFAGTICLFAFLDEKNKCEIGYELLTDFQGKGLMKEAATKVIEYAVQTLKVQKIEAFTHKDNQRSTKLLEKIEFKKSIESDNTDPDYFVYTFSKKL